MNPSSVSRLFFRVSHTHFCPGVKVHREIKIKSWKMLDKNTRHDTYATTIYLLIKLKIDGWSGSNAHRRFAVPFIEALVVHDKVVEEIIQVMHGRLLSKMHARQILMKISITAFCEYM